MGEFSDACLNAIMQSKKPAEAPKGFEWKSVFSNIKVASDISRLQHFEINFNSIYHKPRIIIILGKRGSGKTSLAFRILENVNANTDRKCYALNFPRTLPNWITHITTFEEAENNSVVFVDESTLNIPAQQGKKKIRYLLGLMAIARHKDVSLVFVNQHSSTMDLNVIRQADILVLKQPSLMQKETERPAVKKLLEKVEGKFKMECPEKFFFVIADDFQGMMNFDMPSFWSNDISKAYKNR